MNKDRIRRTLKFIQDTYSTKGEKDIQIFFTRNIVGDYMETVYEDKDVTIDFAPGYWYVEVFGLSTDEENWIEDNVLVGMSNFEFTASWETKLEDAKV